MTNRTIARVRAHAALPTADTELLRRFVATRDDEAFAELVARYGLMVIATCRRIVPDAHLAEDAFQGAFIVLAAKVHSLDLQKPIGPWLYTVACHVAVRARTMIGRRAKRETLTDRVLDMPAISAGSDDTAAILDEEIGKLSAVAREAVVLCELQGLSRKDAATRLGIPEGTLSSRLAAARKTLAAKLRARGVIGPLVMAGVIVPPSLASAAVAGAEGCASKVGQELANGVLRTMLISKLKRTSILIAMVLALLGLGGWGGSLLHAALAALAPMTKPDAGLIWLHNDESGKLTAYSPDGTQQKELEFSGGSWFLGFTEDGANLFFAARGKRAGASNDDSLTLHLRNITGTAKSIDTGIAYRSGDQFVWSPDGKRIVRQRLDKIADSSGHPSYSHVLFDGETGKETVIPLAANRQVMQWTADGKAWRVFEFNASDHDQVPSCRWWSVPVDGGEPSPLCDSHSLNWLQPSPGGESFLATGFTYPKADGTGPSVFHFNAAMGEPIAVKTFANAAFVVARRSPDGKQIACMKYHLDVARSRVSGSQLVLFDADGNNEKTLFDFPGDTRRTALIGWFPARTTIANFDPPSFIVAHAGSEAAETNQPPAVQNRPIQLHAPKGDSLAAKQLEEVFDAANAKLREAKPGEIGPILIETVAKIVAHARLHPTDEASLHALVKGIGLVNRASQMANTGQGEGGSVLRARGAKIREELFEVMKANFAKSPAIRADLPYLANEFSDGARAFVREVISNHPDKAVRAYASKEMIKALETQSSFLKGINASDEIHAHYEQQIGKQRLQEILDSVPQKLPQYQKEIESYRIALRTELKGQLPDLEIGAVAPETVSENPEGKRVKLSDLRGKVVVLDFWGVWCEPCRRLIPHSRELVKRFEGKPFVFVNICVRDEKETLAQFLRKEPMPWTHWWDPKAVVAQQWDIAAFPTLYVIDHKGVIQFMTRGYDPKTGTLEKKIEELIKIAEGEK